MTSKMQKLCEMVSADKELQTELTEELKGISDKSESMQKTIAFAKAHGITLTESDFVEDNKRELSEDELEAVAGGGTCTCETGGYGIGDTLSCNCIYGGGGSMGCCTGAGNGVCACVKGGTGATN